MRTSEQYVGLSCSPLQASDLALAVALWSILGFGPACRCSRVTQYDVRAFFVLHEAS